MNPVTWLKSAYRKPDITTPAAETVAAPPQRTAFLVMAAIALGLWIWSIQPLAQNWNNPNEDGFSAIPAFYATLTMFPVSLLTLIGGARGRGRAVLRARTALVVGTVFVAAFLAIYLFFTVVEALGY